MAFEFNPITGKLDLVTGVGGIVAGGTAECVLYIDSSGNLACTTNFKFSAAATQIQLSDAWATFGATPVSAGLLLTNTSAPSSSNLTRGLDFNFDNNTGSTINYGYIYAGSTGVSIGNEGGLFGIKLVQAGTMADVLKIDAGAYTCRLTTAGYDLYYDGSVFGVGWPDSSAATSLLVGSAYDQTSTVGLFHGDYTVGWSWVSDPTESDIRFKQHVSSASGTDRLIVDNSGDFQIVRSLGIGTTPGSARLAVAPGVAPLIGATIAGDIAGLYDVLQCINASASATYLVVSKTGDVGLNISSPQQMLHLNKGHIRCDQIARTSSAPTATAGAAGVLTGAYYYTTTFVAPSGETQYNGISAVVNPSSQQVGLTNIPVSADSTVTARKIYRSTFNSGDVRLQYLATISDNVTTTYTDNVADGSLGAGLDGNTTGGSFYIGSVRTWMFDNNCFSIGQSAGTKGFRNCWVGHGAGASVTTGYENIGIGPGAGGSINTGAWNICLGYNAGASVTTATSNVAIGRASLRFCVTGGSNMALGTNAGFYALGASNTLIGTSAGYGVSTTSTFSNVTAIGVNAGYSLTVGDNNVLLGGYAGRYIVDGVSNVCVGYNCGDNLTTGCNYNILIGYGIDAQSATGSNQVSIGNLIFGTHTNSGTTASTGSVGIGAPNPLCPLTLAYKASTASVADNSIGIIGSSISNRGSRIAYDDSGNAQFGTYILNNADITQNTATQTARYTSAQSIRLGLHSTATSSGIGFYCDTSLVAGNTFTPTQRMIIEDDGKVAIATSAANGQLTIERNNTDYTNTAGAGTHLLLTNANASGISAIMGQINGANSFKIRGDSSGNLTWVSYANAANLGHFFYVNGDYGTGSCYMSIGNKGVVIGSAAASTSSQAWLTLTIGGSGANQAPLKFQSSSGTLLATPEAGAVEFSTDNLYLTITTGTARKSFILDDGTTLTSGRVPYATTNGRLTDTSTFTKDTINATTINFVIDGAGTAITTGIKGDIEIPFACTIQRLTMLADQSGSIVVDIWKDTYANFPPTDADSITASAVPTITTATKSQDATLTGWTTSITAGDILRFNVDSATTITRLTISLKVTK